MADSKTIKKINEKMVLDDEDIAILDEHAKSRFRRVR